MCGESGGDRCLVPQTTTSINPRPRLSADPSPSLVPRPQRRPKVITIKPQSCGATSPPWAASVTARSRYRQADRHHHQGPRYGAPLTNGNVCHHRRQADTSCFTTVKQLAPPCVNDLMLLSLKGNSLCHSSGRTHSFHLECFSLYDVWCGGLQQRGSSTTGNDAEEK